MVEKNQRGITLIALVITIIVLLILAGISISMLAGDNSILQKSTEAKERYEYGAAKEIIDLKLTDINSDAISKGQKCTMEKIATGMTEDTEITIDQKYFNATGSLKTGVSDNIVNLKGIVVSVDQYSRFKFLISGENNVNKITGYTTESVPDTWTTGDLPTGFIAIGESKQGTPTPPGATTYTVTFKDGETTLSTQTVEEGQTATKPTDPTKDDFDFVNWYSDSEFTAVYDFTSIITGNTTIFAKWEETAPIESYIGKYADINGDGTIDGIIYVDLLDKAHLSGTWNNKQDSTFSITTDVTRSNVKEYVISQEGQKDSRWSSTEQKDVVKLATTNQTGKKERFYVMGLTDITCQKEGTTYNELYWYYNANGKMSDYSTATPETNTGRQNTSTIKAKWDLGTGGYGATDPRDMWGKLPTGPKAGANPTEAVSDTEQYRWFIPSRAEWSAFGNNLGITGGTYRDYGLSGFYWTSSQIDEKMAWGAWLALGMPYNRNVDVDGFVRASATF